MTEYLMGLKDVWRYHFHKKKWEHPPPPEVPKQEVASKEDEEIVQLLEEVAELRKVLKESLSTLKEWERVNRDMLYPHQHNTGSLNRETIYKIESIL